MVKDEEISAARSSAGKSGAEKRWGCHRFAIAKPIAKGMANTEEEVEEEVEDVVKGGAGGKRKADLLALDGLPEEFACDAFKAAWADWVGHRRDIRHPLTPRMVKAQFAKFGKMGVARAIAALQHSTANGWQGIFEPETNRGNSGNESRLGRVEAPVGKYSGVRIVSGPPATPHT